MSSTFSLRSCGFPFMFLSLHDLAKIIGVSTTKRFFFFFFRPSIDVAWLLFLCCSACHCQIMKINKQPHCLWQRCKENPQSFALFILRRRPRSVWLFFSRQENLYQCERDSSWIIGVRHAPLSHWRSRLTHSLCDSFVCSMTHEQIFWLTLKKNFNFSSRRRALRLNELININCIISSEYEYHIEPHINFANYNSADMRISSSQSFLSFCVVHMTAMIYNCVNVICNFSMMSLCNLWVVLQ